MNKLFQPFPMIPIVLVILLTCIEMNILDQSLHVRIYESFGIILLPFLIIIGMIIAGYIRGWQQKKGVNTKE